MAEIEDPQLSQIARAIGRKLEELAGVAQMTTRQVAEAADVSAGIVSLWYRGKRMPRMENMVALAKLHGVDLGELYEYVPGMARTDAQMRVLRRMNKLPVAQQDKLADGLDALSLPKPTKS